MVKSVQNAIEIAEKYNEFKIIRYFKEKRSYKIELECLNCKNVFSRETRHFIESPHMCPKCRPKMFNLTITLEEAQKRVDNVYGENHLTLLEYKGNNTKINVRCENCFNIFQSVPVSLWRNRVRGCPICEKVKSIGEQKIEEVLIKNKIDYRAQKRFNDCINLKPLPFDFFLPDYNICIEFQGEQHYNERSFLWSEELIKHDMIKRDFCKKNNIKLIEIPYYDIKHIENYFDFLKCD